MTTPTADQKYRNQATTKLGSTLFVEAGAGTGKTTMLVERVVNLVVSGQARMEHIAAITFTEAAAAELRDRLAEQFEKLATDGPDDRAADAAAVLDAAAVTTLHSFARKVLSEHPFDVGLPPLFEVADASSSRVAFDERWGRFVNELLESAEHEDLVARALSCGLTWEQLHIVALNCDENWDLVEATPLNVPPPALDVSRLSELMDQAVALRVASSDPADRLVGHLNGTVWSSLHAVKGAAGEIDLLQILTGFPKLTTNLGVAKNWGLSAAGTPLKSDIIDLLRAADDECHRLVDATVQWLLTCMFGLIVDLTLRAADERRATGRLAFHDLLVLARRLVTDHPAARQELHDRYTHILIDEFQDTDPIQAELALHLAAAHPADNRGDADWADLVVPPGRLFFVGDPKQSIYRFRRADIDVFMKVRDRVVGKALPLTTNFRSRPAIVDWVNAVFAGMFGAGVPGKQPAYEGLVAHEDKGRDNDRGLRPVLVLGQTPLDGSATEVRTVQAAEVVATIATLHREQWKVDKDLHSLRFSDVAVLVRTRTGLEVLEAAFRAADMPYRLESSSLVYESAEVQQLLAILRAVDDPTDAVSVLAALRSPAFGCGDDDLYRHAAAGGGWDPRAPARHEGLVADAMGDLLAAYQQRWWTGVSPLVSDIVADRRLMALALADRRPRESWRRLRFVVDQARVFDESNGGDLRAFLRWVGHQQEDGARVTEAILPETDDDAVRVSTVHAAKGLEYPVTVLMGLQTKPKNQRPPLLFGAHGPELHLRDSFETLGYADALEHEREMEAYEARRLLYVAATRARDVVLVSLHRDESLDTLAAQLAAQCEACPELWDDASGLCADLSPLVVPPNDDQPASAPDSWAERTHFVEERDRLLARAAIPKTIAATGVQGLARRARDGEADSAVAEEPEAPADSTSSHRRGRAGTAIGRAVHGVLQVIDLASGEQLESLCRAQAVAEGIADRQPEVQQRVHAALESEVVRTAVAGGRFWRELYVGVPIGERVLEGFIDLLYETPEGLVVVDYKTDRVETEGDATAVAARYRLQGASYALAIETALGQPVAGCTFLVLRPQGAISAPIPDLYIAISEARDILLQSTG